MDIKISSETTTADAKPACMPQLVDWKGACRAIGGDRPISRATLDRLTKSGALKVRRPAPGVVRWALEDLAEYLNAATYPRKAA